MHRIILLVFVANDLLEYFQFHCQAELGTLLTYLELDWKLLSHAGSGYPCDLCSKHCSNTTLSVFAQ